MRLLVLLLILATPSLALELKVGVYDNPPLVFKDGDHYSGLYIDILEEIAKKEGWEIVYVYDKFPNLLEKLKSGEIDLMTAIAYSEERTKVFAFTNETVIVNWGVLVAKEPPGSILELDGKKIVGVRGDVYFLELQKLIKGFEIHCEFFELEGDYKEVMNAVALGFADVGVISRTYASQFFEGYGLKVTNIIFSPVELKFATIPEKRYVIDAIDRNLAEMKNTKGSAYYIAIENWFGEKPSFWREHGSVVVPMAILTLFLVSLAVYLTKIAKVKTRESFESKRFLQSVFNAIQDGISVLDSNMQIIAVNHAMEKWYAKNMPVVGKKCYEAYHDRTSPCENCPTLKAIQSKKVEYAVVPGLKGSQAEWLELFSYPVFDKNGKVVMIVEFVRDVTEKKKTEDRLRELLNEYQYFWNSVNDVLYIHDLEGRILRSNKKGVELTGYEGDVTIWELVEEEYHELVKEKIREIVEKRDVGRYEVPIRSKDGKRYWLEVLASPVIRNSQVVAIQGIARDVTDRKQLIDRLEKDIQLIAHIIDKTRNSLTVARAYCELSKEIGDEAVEKSLKAIDDISRLLSDLDKAWVDSERLREFLFGKKS
ncbi:MAG: PAS domain S-box protein [Archaeoglobaceae archaeon]